MCISCIFWLCLLFYFEFQLHWPFCLFNILQCHPVNVSVLLWGRQIKISEGQNFWEWEIFWWLEFTILSLESCAHDMKLYTKDLCSYIHCTRMRVSCWGKMWIALDCTTTLLLHLFNGPFSRTAWVSRHQKGKPFWILLKQEMMGWQWHQLDHMQIICTSLQTGNHANASPLSFYRPDALTAASKHWTVKANCTEAGTYTCRIAQYCEWYSRIPLYLCVNGKCTSHCIPSQVAPTCPHCACRRSSSLWRWYARRSMISVGFYETAKWTTRSTRSWRKLVLSVLKVLKSKLATWSSWKRYTAVCSVCGPLFWNVLTAVC